MDMLKINQLEIRYEEECEKHELSKQACMQAAFSKIKAGQASSNKHVLELVLDHQMKEVDVAVVADFLKMTQKSELDAVDILYCKNATASMNGSVLLRLLRSCGKKLRHVALKNMLINQEYLGDMFHNGLTCTSLDLSYCHIKKLDMDGPFYSLKVLTLDMNFGITSLPDGCFKAMPSLVKFSMCGTGIRNLWTATAALSKLPCLQELRFQKCVCCQGTGHCVTRATNKDSEFQNEFHAKLGKARFDMSRTEDDLYTTSSKTYSEESSEESDVNNDEVSHGFRVVRNILHLDLLEDSMSEDGLSTSSSGMDSANDMDIHMEDSADSFEFVFGGASQRISASLTANLQSRHMDAGHVSPSVEEMAKRGLPVAKLCGRSQYPSPICFVKHYREFFVASLPNLKVLDNLEICEAEREHARAVFNIQFEHLANGRRENENVLHILHRYERGGLPYRTMKRLGGNDHSIAGMRRTLCASKLAACAWPAMSSICKVQKSSNGIVRRFKPRQFEYHPSDSSLMVFGTLQGEVAVVNHEDEKIVGYVRGTPHSVLGLCWLNKAPDKLISGSEDGSLELYDVNLMRTRMLLASKTTDASSLLHTSRSPTIYTYENFESLTSVHINSTDDYFLASGYSKNVGLYDLCTGKQLQIFRELHQEHINVVKFAHQSPHVFATSSFDKDIKMWDLRQKVVHPIYTVSSTRGNVMVCFSPDDHFLLSSAVDNEVKQYLAVDGSLHMKFDIATTSSNQNYTRSYYMNGRDYIITGSCEENTVHICSSQTGRHLKDLTLEGRSMRNSLYVQSLRGDPSRDFHLSVLVAYNHPHSKSEIVKVNLLAAAGEDKEDVESQSLSLSAMGA